MRKATLQNYSITIIFIFYDNGVTKRDNTMEEESDNNAKASTAQKKVAIFFYHNVSSQKLHILLG